MLGRCNFREAWNGTNYYSLGSAISTTKASTTTQTVVSSAYSRYFRAAITTAITVYAALLALERDRFERSERTAARMKAEGDGTFCRRNTGGLLERLEAGDTVRVGRATVESALWQRDRPPRPVRLPFDREVRSVRVSPDDRIVPAAAEDAH